MVQFLKRKTVLFSDKYNWEKSIRRRLNTLQYKPFFKSFSEVNFDEFDVLIPQHLTDIVFLNNHYPELHGQKCFIPSLEALNICNDKMQFNHFVTNIGLGECIPKVSANLPYPYILKSQIDENGTRTRIINNEREAQPFQKFIASDNYYRQECIAGSKEFTTHILMVDGKAIFHRTFRFSFNETLFVKGVGCKPSTGTALKACPYLDVFITILNNLKFEGLCCFDYKVFDRKLKIFELNPRYGGSLTRFLMPMMKVYSKTLEPINHDQ